jgi:methylenetetrahydrofolate dehydrogenase (NADP+)/methenyltetrahydrofolate cyclohydrolase
VDGVTDASLRLAFVGRGPGFCPCTPEAVLELLAYYGISTDGARVCILGRSLVVGRPLALLLTVRNATVTVCHTHTRETAALCREADILISATGDPGLVTADFVRPGQIVVDIGTRPNADGKLRGDAAFDEIAPLVGAISPVPGGVGAITTTVLLRHVVEAAENRA